MREYIGIDISKASLQVHLGTFNEDIEVENSLKGVKQLHAKVKKRYGKSVEVVWIYEPTGSYSTLVKRFCAQHAIACYIIKPSQSAAFAKTIKNRNKSDVVDARMLYQLHKIAPSEEIAIPHYDAKLETLQNYLRYYKTVMKERVVKTNQLEAALHREDELFIIRKLRSKIKALKAEEKEIITTMLELIKANKAYEERFSAMTSLKGIGNISGLVLFDLFMRYEDASSKEIVALCGLDPIEVSSGSSLKRKSRISKQGSRLVRSTLFMPTLIAINHNPHMQMFYHRLKEKGKHSTAAQIAVMRKMVVIAFSLFKNKEIYDTNRFLKLDEKKVA